MEQVGLPKGVRTLQKECICLHPGSESEQSQEMQDDDIYGHLGEEFKKMKLMPTSKVLWHRKELPWKSQKYVKKKWKSQRPSGTLRWPPDRSAPFCVYASVQSAPFYGYDVTCVSVLRLAECASHMIRLI